jgi:uncharacterized protein YaeQ
MGPPVTLYRFRLDLSDVDRGVYEQLDIRVAQHPSETQAFLLTRVLAFALNCQAGLEFSPSGLHDPDVPTISVGDPNGRISLWIEIGNPSAKKLHKASKAASLVKVYTYKDPQALLNEVQGQSVHRAEQIEVYSLKASFLDELAKGLERDNRWSILHNDGLITVSTSTKNFESELKKHSLLN